MSQMGTEYIRVLTDERGPLDDDYLAQAERDARRFSGAWTGTSGTLAAHVMRLLRELSRVKGELAVERARRVDS